MSTPGTSMEVSREKKKTNLTFSLIFQHVRHTSLMQRTLNPNKEVLRKVVLLVKCKISFNLTNG